MIEVQPGPLKKDMLKNLACRPCALMLVSLCLASMQVAPALQAQKPVVPPPGPMMDGGHTVLRGAALSLDLLRYSGTVAGLAAVAQPAFDYTPGDRLKERSADTFYHLGDLDLRLRTHGQVEWRTLSTAYRRAPVKALVSTATEFRADISSSLPADSGLRVVRSWQVDHDEVRLHFLLTNTSGSPLELGGVGIPMVFNNNLNDRTLDQAYTRCSFYDPYIGDDAGYVQVVPLKGTGPVLLVAPLGHTPLEAWKPILDHRDRSTGLGELGNDPTPRGTTFEGSFDWMVHSAAFAQTEWKGAEQWNVATSEVLAPGETAQFGLRFFLAPGLRQVEATLAEHQRPVAVGIPGYILPQDTDGRLFLNYRSPVRSIVSEPAGALTVNDDGKLRTGLHAYTLHSRQWGRARLTIRYGDGTIQTIGYRSIKPERETLTDLGHFLFHEQWFTDADDPFGRAPSVISYDDAAHSQIRQEQRVWIAGLSDEAGAGSWLAAAMKELLVPDAEEVGKLESFVDGVLWGHLQEKTGEGKFGIHKSLFFYQPDAVNYTYNAEINWKTWTSWNEKDAADLGRAYNYPHAVAAYWSLYRIARNASGLATKHPWQWYLNQAFETSMAMRSQAPYYTQFGLMEGTVFLRVLEDLRSEGMTDKANALEGWMREREAHWRSEQYPFGSEMPWDSTGQEEVYAWSRHFGDTAKADITLNAVLAYTPTIPSWGYNGSARRYWDFLYGGKYPRIERQLHHYGSGLNAIPLLTAYRDRPTDLYLLRTGYGGVMGPLASIDQKGFASAAFHSFPDRMAFDPYTGDYGPNLFGHAVNTATYVTHDDRMGWLCFGGNLAQQGDAVRVTLLDSSRQHVFLAPWKLWITLDAGQIEQVVFNPQSKTVRVDLAAATRFTAAARLRVQGPDASSWRIEGSFRQDAGAYQIPLGVGTTSVTLRP